MEEMNMDGNSKRKKLAAAIGCATVLLVGIILWYFMYFIKTPAYSLNLVRESIEKHDLVKFNKHVDLESVLARGYDDLIEAMLETDSTLKGNECSFALKLAKGFKGLATTALKEGTQRFVETGSWDKAKQGDSADEKAASKMNSGKYFDAAGVKKSEFKGIEYTKKEGKIATVGLKLRDKELDKEYVLDVKMRELEDGSWQVVEFANLKEYFAAVEKEKNEHIKRYLEACTPFTEQYNKAWTEIVKKVQVLEQGGRQLSKVDETGIIENDVLPMLEKYLTDVKAIKVLGGANELHTANVKTYELYKAACTKRAEALASDSEQAHKEARELMDQYATEKEKVDNIVKKVKSM